MKRFRQILSVFLCAVFCCSAFAVSAQAKTAKKYVKSIAVSTKGTIKIPYNKKTLSKSFKVTVKVVGKASKAFTAKVGNTSVATVKVSGIYVKVTAKKAGTTNVRVTTKDKNSKGKKLSAVLKLTVKKEKKPIPASINEYYTDNQLGYSEYADNGMFNRLEVWNVIENANPNAYYCAEVEDKSVADTRGNRTVIYSTGVGTTTAKVYEGLDDKETLLGTVNITVTESTMSEAADNVLMSSEKGDCGSVWLKLDFEKKTFDMKNAVLSAILDKDAGSKFKESDFTLSFSSNDSTIAEVSDDGIITGLNNGIVTVIATLTFTDSTEAYEYSEVRVTGNAIEKVEGYTIDNVRDYIIGLDTPIELKDGTKQPLINFDNAATTPAFKAVQDAVNEELLMYGSIGRGFSQKSNHSTDVYNSVRDKVLQFLGADPEFYTCFYTNSTTDGLNKLASALVTSPSDIVLTTRIEHHANDLSWRERCKVIYAEVDEQGRVIYDDIEKLLKKNKVKIVSISAASNVTGYVDDVHRVAKMAHKYGAMIVVDGAQIVAHRKFSMVGDLNDPTDDIDFIAFSAHKMYSPYGGGAVVGITSELNKHMPTFYGGGTIRVVGDDWRILKEAPAVYEAGSPNYPGVVGLGKAIDVLSTIGMDKIEAHEKVLNRKLIDGLKTLPNVILYGDVENIEDRVGVVTFNFSDINTHFLAESLSELGGVATRRGAFCAHPYVWRLMNISDEKAKSFANCTDINTAGMVRISFGIYNNEDEVDSLLDIMPTAMADAKEKNKLGLAEPEY